ncbi:argonaute-like protein [Irpex rosettiformis]|uniref:Argonaute-like protein n=1 Tax=Irpex rosettiformis TaxID=378272 RepID=A0ACB8TSK1_9APHY|nr:argonaute-like protein [Irpex rosettiformis]
MSNRPDRTARGRKQGRGPNVGGGYGRGSTVWGSHGRVFPHGQVSIDSRLENESEDTLIQSLNWTSHISNNELPIRPDFGTLGTPIKLRTNYFPITAPPGVLYEYTVTVVPSVESFSRSELQHIYNLAEHTNDWAQAGMQGKVAHDYHNRLISYFKLPQPLVIHVPITYPQRNEPPPSQQRLERNSGATAKKHLPKEYMLYIESISDLDTQNLQNHLHGQLEYRDYNILPIISAVNIILDMYTKQPGGNGVVVRSKKFFCPSAAMPLFPLGPGHEAWQGFHTSVVPAHKQLMVNVSTCIGAFYIPGNLAKILQSFMTASFDATPNSFFRQVRIKVTHFGDRRAAINHVLSLNARQRSFETEFGRVMVEDYYKRKYNIALQFPELPLIRVAGSNVETVETVLPAELCVVLGKQKLRRKLSQSPACRPPNANAAAIMQGIRELGYVDEQDPLRAFGISIGNEMAVIPGRILQPPKIKYGQGVPSINSQAGWNLCGVKFAVGGRLDNWAVLLIRDGSEACGFHGPQDPMLRTTIYGFIDVCRKSGIEVAGPPDSVVEARLPRKTREHPTRSDAIQTIRATLTSIKKPKLLFVVLSNGDSHVYAGLKHLADSYLDVATICVQVERFRKERGQVQYFANVALKLNMKLGGINHRLEGPSANWLNMAPTMLVGIKVMHPPPVSPRGTPSIAAVVASTDKNFSQFPASLRIQQSRKEVVLDLCDIMVERLNVFKAKSNVLPQRIIIYRCGISKDKVRAVLEEEIPEIMKAFTKLKSGGGTDYKPKITVVICDKRPHTLFFPTKSQHAAEDGNPVPGTVVDRGITAIYEFDFFLQAHGTSTQGTARPVHYYVVRDDIGFTADILQSLTNDMSYMSARTTKAVRLVSPAYYADLACKRGRCYLHRLHQGLTNTADVFMEDNETKVYQEGEVLWRGGVSPSLRDTMFYL